MTKVYITKPTIDRYMNGCCVELAVTLHRKTKLPLAAYVNQYDSEFTALHAFIMLDDIHIVDIKGRRTLDNMRADFSDHFKKQTKFRFLTEEIIQKECIWSLNEIILEDCQPYADELIRRHVAPPISS